MPSFHLRAGLLAGASALLLITLALTAFWRSDRVGSVDAEAPVLRIGFGIGNSARDPGVSSLADLFYTEALLNREWDGRLTPKLATSWAWERQGHALRLRLKPGVLLHDGTPLTAELVLEQLQRLVPAAGGSAAWGFNYVTRATAPDSSTVLIELSQPDMFLLAALSDFGILHPTLPDVGTGPFRLVARTPVVEAVRFDRYHGGQPSLAGVRIVTYDTQRSTWAALMRGEVDVVQEVSRESVEFMEDSSNVRTYSSLQPFYVPLVFNVRHPILRKVEVRRALVEALDRREIVARAMRGRGQVADGPIWPFHWAYAAAREPQEYRPDQARARLDAAGFRQAPDGPPGQLRARFSLRCLVYNEDPQYERIALMVQRQLFDVGVHLEIQLVPLDELAARIAKGDFETYMVRANASRTLERTYRFWRSTGPMNQATQDSGYTGADELLDQLRRSTSEEEMRSAVSALAQRFREDAPAAFIAWLEITRAVDADLDVGERPAEDPFANIWRWKRVGMRPQR